MLKKQYLDTICAASASRAAAAAKAVGGAVVASGRLSGQSWYTQSASRAVNQVRYVYAKLTTHILCVHIICM